mmetsp:Transcript_46795/g.97953  ORF Transcript_46795/g.97953 Transcript_46795/m.97953 type:complete len:97 (+) Transcript_46795:1117-1407(+)
MQTSCLTTVYPGKLLRQMFAINILLAVCGFMIVLISLLQNPVLSVDLSGRCSARYMVLLCSPPIFFILNGEGDMTVMTMTNRLEQIRNSFSSAFLC